MPRTLTASDCSNLIRIASTLPKGSTERRAILAGLKRVKTAHRPVLVTPKDLREKRGFMTYKIDAAKNNSKFYEGLITEQPDGLWSYQRRWGALTDDGPDRRRVDGARFDKFDLEENVAQRLLDMELAKRVRSRGYKDAMKTRPLGQYPVGLDRTVGFGWGTQGITKCVPQLREISKGLLEAMIELDQEDAPGLRGTLADLFSIVDALPNSSMAKEVRKHLRAPLQRMEKNPRLVLDPARTRKELMTLKRYIDRQTKECNI
jgi:hypothetical protein